MPGRAVLGNVTIYEKNQHLDDTRSRELIL